MKVLNYKEIRELEINCMAQFNMTSRDLICIVAEKFVNYFLNNKEVTNSAILIMCGNGKNGADGLQIANLLSLAGLNVEVGIIYLTPSVNEEFEWFKNNLYNSVPSFTVDIQELNNVVIPNHDILIDAIFGIGLNRELSIEMINLIENLNNQPSYKIAVDIPSGLKWNGDSAGNVLRCDETFAAGTAKMAYFLCEKEDYIGKLTIANIEMFDVVSITYPSSFSLVDVQMAKGLIKPLNRITHKFELGSALIIGGSHGMAGCMKLCGEAALRTGCGLISLHVPYSAVDFLQGSFPEAIIHVDDNKYNIGPFDYNGKYSAIGIGPGMGTRVKQEELLISLFEQISDVPIVIDADALTLLSGINDWQKIIPEKTILTPHRGEFERLFGVCANQTERIEIMSRYSISNSSVIVLKGPDTIISTPEGEIYFINIGNSGMATAGSGDVLTGILTSLLAQGQTISNAAVLGTYIHALSGKFAAEQKGQRSLIASDLINHISSAYHILEDKE